MERTIEAGRKGTTYLINDKRMMDADKSATYEEVLERIRIGLMLWKATERKATDFVGDLQKHLPCRKTTIGIEEYLHKTAYLLRIWLVSPAEAEEFCAFMREELSDVSRTRPPVPNALEAVDKERFLQTFAQGAKWFVA